MKILIVQVSKSILITPIHTNLSKCSFVVPDSWRQSQNNIVVREVGTFYCLIYVIAPIKDVHDGNFLPYMLLQDLNHGGFSSVYGCVCNTSVFKYHLWFSLSSTGYYEAQYLGIMCWIQCTIYSPSLVLPCSHICLPFHMSCPICPLLML